MTEYSERHEKMKGRNYTVLAVLAGMVVLFLVVTIVKLSGASG